MRMKSKGAECTRQKCPQTHALSREGDVMEREKRAGARNGESYAAMYQGYKASEPHVAKSHHHVEHQLSARRAFEKRCNSVFDVSPRLELSSFSRVAEVVAERMRDCDRVGKRHVSRSCRASGRFLSWSSKFTLVFRSNF